MYNKVILVGNLTRDIELRHSQAGMAIAKSAIATSRKFKSNTGEQKEEVCFVDITFFGRSAEIANQYLRKGSKILVEGKLVFEQWTDQNGQKRSKHGVTVDIMQMLDTKGVGNDKIQNTNPTNEYQPQQGMNSPYENNNPTQQANTYPLKKPQTYANTPSANDIPSIDIDEDEIPF